MIEIRRFASLGHADHGWLDAHHHFSFASYLDRNRMGWGAIRVWNDDTIAAGTGFDPHPHENMEIVTYVREGAISHGDNLGNRGRTVAGDVQVMSAGRGIVHSEHNREAGRTTLFQIWVRPDTAGGDPFWDQREFPRGERSGQWVTLASGAPEPDGALPVRADARVLGANLAAGQSIGLDCDPSRHIYMVAPSGGLVVNGIAAAARDGIAITDETRLTVRALDDTEIVLVDAR